MIGENPGASGGIYATVIPFLLLLSMLVVDVRKQKRPHNMTLIGIISYLLFVASAFILNVSGIALKVIEWMR